MPDGVTTSYLDPSTTVVELLGNSEGGTVRIAIELVAAIIAQSIPGPNLTTQAELLADLDWDEPTLGAVWGDANSALNGVYKKSGAAGAGAWSRIGDLPMSAATAAALAAKAPLVSPDLTGVPTAPTPAPGTNNDQLATTSYIKTALDALIENAPGTLDTLNELASALNDDPDFAATMTTALAAKAPLDAPSFTGNVKVPTALAGTNSTTAASTAFVQAAVSVLADVVASKAPLASPALTGVPTAPTPDPGTNNDQLATTSFIKAALDALIENAPGALDTLNELASALNDDPDFAATMTTALAAKAPLDAPSFTGNVKVPTALAGTNSTTAASTAFVDAALAGKVEADALTSLTSGGASMEVRGSLVALKDRDGRMVISFDWNRGRQAVQVHGHALSADVDDRFGNLTFSGMAARGVLVQLLGADGKSLLDLLWDRTAQAPRWRGHALSGDVDAAMAHAEDLVNTTALAARGVLAALASDDGKSLLDLLWDRTAQAPRWRGHALSAEVIGAAKVGDIEAAPGYDARAERQDFVCQTDADGLAWVRLPELPSSAILGVNNSGTALELRRAWGLPMRGLAYLGDWSPGAVATTSDQGTFTTSLPDASGLSDGVYYEQAAAAGNTVGGITYAQGDLAVVSGGAWVKQAAPLVTVTEHGSFFTVTASGTFKGIALSVGDRLIYAGRARESNVYDRLCWTKLDADRGQVALMGETATPVSVPPASPQDGDLWYVTASDGAYGAGDGLLRRDGAWMRLPAPEVTTVANGASLWLPCANVAEYEVRRADKGDTRVAARLSAMVERRAPATRSRDVWVVGDSMPGFLDPKFAAAMPDRTVMVDSWGGAISYEVLSQVERSILDFGDPYGDRVWIGWHGQNNVGYYDQTNEVNDRLARLSGARGGRVVLMSVLGQWTASFAGGRIVVSNHENQFNDTSGQLRLVRNHLRDNHEGAFFDTRAELCATAGDTPALLHPGMSERDVAETYGIAPFSYFFDLTTVPWNADDLVFQGYHSAAGLPTGGADNDYYIRSAVDGSDPVGQLLIRESGTWVTRQITDITHMRPDAGNVALVGRIAEFLKQKDW